jgi:hypothetical protein
LIHRSTQTAAESQSDYERKNLWILWRGNRPGLGTIRKDVIADQIKTVMD